MIYVEIKHKEGYYNYFFKKLNPEILETFLKRKVEETKATDDFDWDHTVHKTILNKIKQIPIPGNLILDYCYSIHIKKVVFEKEGEE